MEALSSVQDTAIGSAGVSLPSGSKSFILPEIESNSVSCSYLSAATEFGLPLRTEDSEGTEVYLAVVWQSGILGAAVYWTDSASVDLLMDIPEGPQFETLRSLILATKATQVAVSQGCDIHLKEFLEEVCQKNQLPPEGATDGTGSRVFDLNQSDAPKLCLMISKEFALGPCRQRIDRVKLPFMPENITEPKNVRTFLSTLIDFNRFAMVRSFGGLLHFMDKFLPRRNDGENAPIIAIKMFSMEDSLTIDSVSQRYEMSNMRASLGIRAGKIDFYITAPLGSSTPAGTASKEGLSLFGLFNRCKSAVGTKLLRQWFNRPMRNFSVLRSRHQAVRFFMNEQHDALKTDFQKLLAGVKDIGGAVGRMAKGSCTLNDWAIVEKTSLCACTISRLVKQEDLPHDIAIFGKIVDTFTEDLARIAKIISDVVDFESSAYEERFVVMPTVSNELDEMKRKLHSLNETLTYIAAEELEKMSASVQEIRVTYIPHMGYLLVLQESTSNDGSSSGYAIAGLDFVFKAKSGLFYKSERMLQLDKDYGDLGPNIHDCERGIMMQLQEVILRHTKTLLDMTQCAAELDCLIAVATTAALRNYVLPHLADDIGLEIVNGRHPLQELCVTTFVPNPTKLSDSAGRVNVITGPNMSGKSVYLKQVAVIVFLAHVGCPVPADIARIGFVDKIFTRILTEETVAVHQSAFLIDLTQAGLAVNYATEKSLVIFDEFGKGTRSSDGLALLASILKYFKSGGARSKLPGSASGDSTSKKSPFILLATHFHSLKELIPPSVGVQYQTMGHMKSEEDNLVFLYTINNGTAESSYGFETSKAAGFPSKTLDRIHEVTEGLRQNRPIKPIAKLRTGGFCNIAKVILETLTNFDPTTQDGRAFLDGVSAIVRQQLPVSQAPVQKDC